MNSTHNAFRLSVIATALFSAFGPAHADEEEINALTKPDSFVSLGVGHWTNDRHQLGIYDGQRERGLFGNVDLSLVQRDDATGTWLRLDGRNLGLSTRELRGEYLRQGDFGVFLEHGRTVRNNPLTFITGAQGIGSTEFVVSGAGAANTFPRSDVSLATRRDETTVGATKVLTENLDLSLTFRNEEKDGTRQWGRGGAPEFAVEPINSSTRELTALLNYVTEAYQLSGGYTGSWYRNYNGLVDTRVQGTTSNRFFLTLPLSNEAHQLFVDGGFNVTPTTRGTFKLSYTLATQDERIPTADVGQSLLDTLDGEASFIDGTPQFAPTNLDGKIETTLAQVAFISHPTSDLSLLANLRYEDVAEKTPEVRLVDTQRVTPNNAVPPAGTVNFTTASNTPYQYETLSGKLEATWRLPMRFALTGGIDYKDQDRSVPFGRLTAVGTNSVGQTIDDGIPGRDDERFVPFRANLEETTYRLQLRRPLADTVSGSIGFAHSRRRGSDFTLTNETESDEINPIHISDRDRNKLRLTANWMPNEAFSLQAVVEQSDDEYGSSAARPFGLLDGEARLFSLDATYALAEDWQLVGWYAFNETEARHFGQRAATTGAGAALRDANLKDTGDLLGLSVRGVVGGKTRVGANLEWSRNESRYPQTITLLGTGAVFPTSGGVTVSPLPDIESEVTRLGLFAEYALDKNADVRVDFVHERWETNDWTWTFADGTAFTYGTTTDGTTVTAAPKQVSNFVGARYIYKFQ